MPIRFRCSYCNRRLAIATRKAGAQTKCPHCAAIITVPTPAPLPPTEMNDKTEALDFKIPELLDETGSVPAGVATAPAPTVAASPELSNAPKALSITASRSAPIPPPIPPMRSRSTTPPLPPTASPAPSEPPLFLNDLDKLLGLEEKSQEKNRPRPMPTSGMDALSLSDSGGALTISATKALILTALVILLMVVAFFAGMAVGGRQ